MAIVGSKGLHLGLGGGTHDLGDAEPAGVVVHQGADAGEEGRDLRL